MNTIPTSTSEIHADVLIAEIGSTTTVVTAFGGLEDGVPYVLAQGKSFTTVTEGDVGKGLQAATRDLEAQVARASGRGAAKLTWDHMLATSSAAGGLRMTVHGLVYDMTVRAAKEAALGAGAIVKLVTAGKLTEFDLKKVRDIRPNIVLLAGGVDYGEKETAVHNARALAALCLDVPVIYAGNVAAREEVADAFSGSGTQLVVVDNVYPGIDRLNVEPARKVIQEVFERHITGAPGMARIREMVDLDIIPTPGAVMEAAKRLYDAIGDLVVVDIGGATTDVHSVTEGTEEIRKYLVHPEPTAKRTVEGDLGVFVNARHVADMIGIEQLSRELGFDAGQALEDLSPLPEKGRQVALVKRLAAYATSTALARHAGEIRDSFGPAGRFKVAYGRDLTGVRWVIGTGGVFTRLPGGAEILRLAMAPGRTGRLLPPATARALVDSKYIMAACGVLARRYPKQAVSLLRESLDV